MLPADQKNYLDHFVTPTSQPDDSPICDSSQEQIVTCSHYCQISSQNCELVQLFDTPCNDCPAWDIVKSAAAQIGPFLSATMIPLDHSPTCRTQFDASSKPSIPITNYIDRICQYSELSHQAMICAFILVRSLVESHPELQVTSHNVHRLTLISMMTYAKYYDDKLDNNARWARIAGITTAEINALEIAFLNVCHFDLHTPVQAFHECIHELMLFSKLGIRMYSCPQQDQVTRSFRKRFFSRSHRSDSKTSEDSMKEEHPKDTHPRTSVIAFFQPRRRLSRLSHHSEHSSASSTPSSTPSPSSKNSSFHLLAHFHITHRKSKKCRNPVPHDLMDLESDNSSVVSCPSEVDNSCACVAESCNV